MTDPAGTATAERATADRWLAAFLADGATLVEAPVLMPAGRLLDLYGEDIRARAYVTLDPAEGELMLRPDFTVPVVERHMASGAEPARYAYAGAVFRRQDRPQVGPQGRPREYLQVGFERFDRETVQADAETFALFARLLPAGLTPVTGDIGILMAAVRGLTTSDRRKAALLRHVWRPQRFRRLLDRFSGRLGTDPARIALLDRLKGGDSTALIAAAGPVLGLRTGAEIAARAAALVEDAETPPLAAAEAALLYDLLGLEAPARAALQHLRGIAPLLPAIAPAVDRFAARLDALDHLRVATQALRFEASHGRSAMEYYDGFVFSFLGPEGWPPVASGGRYDALTAHLGAGQQIPAVGGVVRPGLVARLEGA